MLSIFLKYLFFLGPNLIWTICIFLILKNDKIKLEKNYVFTCMQCTIYVFRYNY